MPIRARPSLRRILEDLGGTVLQPVALPGEDDPEVVGVHIFDPLDELTVQPGTLLLGVGVEAPEEICRLLEALGAAGGVALVVKTPVTLNDKVRQTVRDAGVALLGLTRGASWAQIAALLRSLVAEGDVGDGHHDDFGDLFTVANAVCELLDAPVTIEDRASRVVAYSVHQEEADGPRLETVLGRQVPERFLKLYDELGVFQRLYQSREPIYLEMEGMLPRVAIAVRAGDEILGSVWAAVRGPLSPERRRAFTDASRVVGLHLLRQRAGADIGRRVRADLLSTVLDGDDQAGEAAKRLGIATERVCVLAAELSEPAAGKLTAGEPAAAERQRQRFADALSLDLAALYRNAAVALIGKVTYAVVPVPGDRGEARAAEVAEDFLKRLSGRYQALIGVGRMAGTTAEIARSRQDADRVLRVLRARDTGRSVAVYSDTHLESLLQQLADLVAAEDQPPAGPYERLAAYDAEHGTDLLATAAAYLDTFGNVARTAAAVNVHENTLRYRLRRLAEIAGLDLADPDARLAFMLQVRLYGDGRGRGPAPGHG